MRAHTQTYVTDFAVPVDAVSRNFHFIRSVSENFCGCGVCQRSEAVIFHSPMCFSNYFAAPRFARFGLSFLTEDHACSTSASAITP